MIRPGDVIERTDGQVFPDGRLYALVREAPKTASTLFPRVWLEGGQWVPEGEVRPVSQRNLVEAALRGSTLPLVKPTEEWETRYKEEQVHRRRALKKAAKANSLLEPMRQELAKLKKAEARRKTNYMIGHLSAGRDQQNTRKINFIKAIIADDYFAMEEENTR